MIAWSSPYLKQLLTNAFGTWPWLLLPMAMLAVLFVSALLMLLRWALLRRARNAATDPLLDPSASLRIALEELRTKLAELSTEAPPNAVRIVEQLLSASMRLEASDVHLSPLSRGLQISVRLHGTIYNIDSLPAEAAALVANRLKILAKLDLHARDVPQDGRLVLHLGGRVLEARISTLPTEGGERIVLRLVQGSRSIPGLPGLGFSRDNEQRFAELLSRPQGLILVTGPVGSGKSTTLYAGLSHVAQTRGTTTTIVTLEDPVELRLPFATQTQINLRTNLTFASVLRSVLRQDPNVLMVGEIRDRETADIAMQAGLTGHLLLTTIHAEDAIGPFARLIEMGIEPFVLASSVSGSLSQRLVRLLCPACRKTVIATEQTKEKFSALGVSLPDHEYYDAVGCVECDQQGYVGRTMISELLVVDSELRRELQEGVPISTMRANAVTRGLVPLLEDGVRRACTGETSLAEVLRVAG
jgi:general secretion pathway protein E